MTVELIVQNIATSPKIAGVVSVATSATGAGTFLDYIPSDIGKLATLFGLALTIVLIRVHLVNLKKSELELEIMQEDRERRNKLD